MKSKHNFTINLHESQIHSLRQCITFVSMIIYVRRGHKFQHVLLPHWQILIALSFLLLYSSSFKLSSLKEVMAKLYTSSYTNFSTYAWSDTVVCAITWRKLKTGVSYFWFSWFHHELFLVSWNSGQISWHTSCI